MTDLSQIIKPKSDQLNADDLVSGPITIRIREVRVNQSAKEQPVAIFFDGDNGKPWKPCKTMARALTQLWGTCDSQQFVGRSVTLYNDPNVTWGSVKVGGIRIRAVSHIPEPVEIAVSQSKGKRALMRVGTIDAEVRQMPPADDQYEKYAAQTIAAIHRAPDIDKLEAFIAGRQVKLNQMADARADLGEQVGAALIARRAELQPEGKPDHDHGDQFDGTETPEGWDQ